MRLLELLISELELKNKHLQSQNHRPKKRFLQQNLFFMMNLRKKNLSVPQSISSQQMRTAAGHYPLKNSHSPPEHPLKRLLNCMQMQIRTEMVLLRFQNLFHLRLVSVRHPYPSPWLQFVNHLVLGKNKHPNQ